MSASELLHDWLFGPQAGLDAPAKAWLEESIALCSQGEHLRHLATRFALAPRKLGKSQLGLSTDDLAAATRINGWQAAELSAAGAARLLFVLSWPCTDGAHFRQVLDHLFRAADVAEAEILYRGLPLYPFPEAHRERAAEGIRSNQKPLFLAVAHHNPYPAAQLNDQAWNQMVLKTLFVSAQLQHIVGLDQRLNPELGQMLVDYARERRAASRPISPELWRCVGPVANEAHQADLQHTIASTNSHEHAAGILAAQASPNTAIRAIAADLHTSMTWSDIATASIE